MRKPVNATQRAILSRIASGETQEFTTQDKLSARALASRRLVRIRGSGTTWRAEITDDGVFFNEHGEYPLPQAADEAPNPADSPTAETTRPPVGRRPPPLPVPEHQVDSPRRMRAQGKQPAGDGLFSPEEPDPWDEKVFISVKEAAWMLSMPESAIRGAVTSGDVDRVYIGAGTTNYRIVYGSLLAWVNDMPRESSTVTRWWR
ncbi:excisionase [Nocardioides ochotonae]|uniref:excisionase n=1 Tax=Nocardioides ochotonae TaxID=2685869 RepID=UPI0014075608|nr:excisionase [Nocardioides ochotonae]